MSETHRVDVAVVGGGILGLASAYALLRRAPGTGLVVLEKEPTLARHQTGRNSGVIHSGIYYRPGSWKAELCRRGRGSLLDFAARHGIAVRRLGKLIVAVDASEIAHLRELRERGDANGVRGLRELSDGAIRELEPAVTGIAALQVPDTAVIDFADVARRLGEEAERMGATIALDTALTSVARRDGRWILSTTRDDVDARVVLTCAGLQSDRVARLMGAPTRSRIVPFEGRYVRLAPRARDLIRGLVYPVPIPGLPFLGVHFTRRVDDEVWVGPNAVLARGREAYGRRWSARDVASALTYPGFWRLVRHHWPVALEELRRDASPRAFLRECRRYVPALEAQDLLPGPSGIRAQAVGPDGRLIDDFVLLRRSGLVHVANAPSPAATTSLAIGELLADRLLHELA